MPTTSTSSRSPRSRWKARTPSRRRSTASCSPRKAARTRPPGTSWPSSAPRRAGCLCSVDTSNIATAKGADTSKFTPLNKKLAEAIGGAKNISQFFDRDALPAMANNVMIPALQCFIKNGSVDTTNLEAQAKSLYAQQ